MTAFYSFRLFFLIFHGEFRGTDHQRDHLHESPLVVTLPLMLLACGAVAAGWFGVPAILGGDNHWAHFLEPVLGHPPIHVSGTVEALLMGSSILAGVLRIGLAFYLYRLKPQLPTLLAERLSFVYRLLLNKYYIDELYIGAIVKPTLAFSHGVLLRLVDLACIEGVVQRLAPSHWRFFPTSAAHPGRPGLALSRLDGRWRPGLVVVLLIGR
jgi:NADH-quinone oxidoreductase subunit L